MFYVAILYLGFIQVGSGVECPSFIQCDSLLQSTDLGHLAEVANRFPECPSVRDTIALVLRKKGIDFFREEIVDSAVVYTTSAINQYLLSQKVNLREVAQAHYNAGYFSSLQGDRQKEIEHNLKAIHYSRGVAEDLLGRSYIALGQAYQADGALNEARQAYTSALDVGRSSGLTWLLNAALIDFSSLLYTEEKYGDLVHLVLPYVDSTFAEEDLERAQICQNLGGAYLKMGDVDQAIARMTTALNLYSNLNATYEVFEMNNNIARAHQLNGDFKSSRRHLNNAFKSLSLERGDRILSQYYDHLGEYYFEQGDQDQAIYNYLKAIHNLLPEEEFDEDQALPREDQIWSVQYPGDLALYLMDYAQVLEQNWHNTKNDNFLKEALASYQLGDSAFDLLRIRQSTDESALWWRGEAAEFYDKALRACALLKDTESAYGFMEKSRSILLYESLLTSRKIAESENIYFKKYGLLLDSIRLLGNRLISTDDEVGGGDILFHLQLRLRAYADKLEADCLGCVDIKYADTFGSLEDIQINSIDSNSINIYYFADVDSISRLILTSSESRIDIIGSVEELNEMIDDFEELISSKKLNNNDTSIAELSKLLLPEDILNYNNCVIYPSGSLYKLPFEVLVGDAEGDQETLGLAVNIRYDYSSRIANVQEEFSPSGGVLFLSPFSDSGRDGFGQLMHSMGELEEVESLYRVTKKIGQNASLKALAESKDQYGIIHLSTHGNNSANDSYLAFADTTLYLRDMHDVKLKSELVILSACETNVGGIAKGEGVMSLSRAFSLAGANNMISSLWKVSENSTALIVQRFYKNLSKGMSKHAALAQAKRDYLTDNSIPSYMKTPYHWAGLVYYGDDQPIKLQPKSSSIWVWLLSGLVLIGCGFLWNRRRSSGLSV